MSLVNDMLRDLDQRRKESTGSAASVSLTPAPELPAESKKIPVVLYLIVALVIGAGTVFWFWAQQDNTDSTRQLDIAPQVVLEQPAQLPSTDEPLGQVQISAANTPNIENDSAPAEMEIDTFEQDATSIATADIASSPAEMPNEPILGDADRTIERSNSGREIASSAPATPSEGIEGSAETNVSEEINVSEETATDSGSEIVQLTNAPTQEVKNSAQLTPEESDLLAVQNALKLIAENDMTTAYAALEQQILDNRYAHQSRETYAKLLMSEGNLRGAYELNEAGLVLSPNHSGFKKIKARLLIAEGELDAAVQMLLSRAPEVGADLEYHDILATAQLASRDYEGALISYTELVQQNQNEGKWWYGFAASQDSLGNVLAARQGYSQAVRLPNLSANLRRRSQERLAALSQ